MSERPVYLRLTAGQMESIVYPEQGVTMVSLAALLAGRIASGGTPPVDVWEERARAGAVESRGLLLLDRLVDGQPARLADLAADLKLSEDAACTYVRTPLVAGLVEQDPGTSLYRPEGRGV